MLEFNQLVNLAVATTRAGENKKTKYSYGNQNLSYEALNETLRTELKELAGDFNSYRRNKLTLFELIEQTMDEILPKKVIERYMDFAEVRTFAQGDRPIFKRKTGRVRAKQFVTKVGLSGVYEVFKLGEESFELPTSAIGGAAYFSLEEFLDGRVDWAELVSLVYEGMDELIQKEVAQALMGSISQLPTANQKTFPGFNEAYMDSLLAVASAYGDPTIYCTLEFAVKMIPDENWRSNAMKDEYWNNGFLGTYKGHRVVLIPQSYTDETNTHKVIDPGYAWVIPNTGNDKPVKIGMEGQTIVREWENRDNSHEIQVYKKIGVACVMTNNLCVYVDTSLQFDEDEKNAAYGF